MRVLKWSLMAGSLIALVLWLSSTGTTAGVLVVDNGKGVGQCGLLLAQVESCAIRKVADPTWSCKADADEARIHCDNEVVAIAFLRGLAIGSGTVLVPVDPANPLVTCTDCTCSCATSDGSYHEISGDNCAAGADSSHDAHCTDNGESAVVALDDCSTRVTCSNN